jgi:hypothetical protein
VSVPPVPAAARSVYPPFTWHERLLPAGVFHVQLVVTLAFGFALQQLLGALVLFALVQFIAGVVTMVALTRWMNLRMLAAGHSNAQLQGLIGPLLLVGIVVSFFAWPILNELRELPLFQRGPMTVAEASQSRRPGLVELAGLSVSHSETVAAPFKVRVKTGQWSTVESWFAPLRDTQGNRTGQPSLIPPGDQDFSDARLAANARERRAPEWKDRCVFIPPPGSVEAPGLPWFTLVVLGLAEFLLFFTAPRNAA